jgi:NitT/TauT family transport system ATP-binding protein
MAAALSLPKAAKPKLAVSKLNVRFGKVEVLKDIDLTVGEGEFVCLLGPSGCGKSTLLNVIGGFLKPTSGEVTIDGERVKGADPRRIFVFQERGLLPWLSVEENVAAGLFNLPPEVQKERVARYIKQVGLNGFEQAYPQNLSGGMKQRAEVARALAVKPDMLYMDEPFGQLDSISRTEMRMELLRLWAEEKKTILFVTHDIDESVLLADRVVLMTVRPGTVQRIVDIDIPHPRDPSSARYLAVRDNILEEIGLGHKV